MTVGHDKIARSRESLWRRSDYPFMDLRLNGDVSFASIRNPLLSGVAATIQFNSHDVYAAEFSGKKI
jgi:hypothetical protein